MLARKASIEVATDIFNGTKSLNLNTNGNQNIQLGSDFSFTDSEKDFYIRYSSGTAEGINVSLNNVTTSSCLRWFANIQPDNSNIYTAVYDSSRPEDIFRIMASAEGAAGNSTILAQIR